MAIYRANFLYPNSATIDASVNNNFTCQVNGTIINKYQLIIYLLNNTIVYSTGEVDISATPLYDKEILTHVIPANTLTNGNEYKWTIKTWETINSAISKETPFFAYATPTVNMTIPATITSKNYEFIINYSQAQSIPVKRWKVQIFDIDNILIKDSGYSFSGNLRYEYTEFVDGLTYKAKAIIETQTNVIVETSLYTFNIDYSQPSLNIIPTVELLPELSATKTKWSEAVQITGTVTGTYSYVNDFITVGNTGLQINSGSYLTFSSINIPEYFTKHYIRKPLSASFTGDMVELNHTITGDYFKVGYDGTRFYMDINGSIAQGFAHTLTTNYYILTLQHNKVIIREFNNVLQEIYKETIQIN